MRLLRRTVGAVVLLLSAVGIVSCLAGAVGVWVFRQAASEKVTTISARLEVGLQRASVATQNVRRALETASADVGRVSKGSADLGRGNETSRLAAGAMRGILRQVVGPEINEVGGRLATLSDAAVAVSSLLQSFQELPAGPTGRTTPDQMERLAGQASQLSASLQRLQAVVGDGEKGASEHEVVAAAGEIESVLRRSRATVDGWQSDLDAARDRLPHLKSEALRWLTLVAVAVSALCAWVGVSQISLFAHAWGWCRA
jgi:hypothetical protein